MNSRKCVGITKPPLNMHKNRRSLATHFVVKLFQDVFSGVGKIAETSKIKITIKLS